MDENVSETYYVPNATQNYLCFYFYRPKATWVRHQRAYYKKKELSKEQINYLESIGFLWKIRDFVPWIEMYERLVAYKHCHPSTLVPHRYTDDLRLDNWATKQRVLYKKGKLSEKQIQLLNAIDFDWSPRRVCQPRGNKNLKSKAPSLKQIATRK